MIGGHYGQYPLPIIQFYMIQTILYYKTFSINMIVQGDNVSFSDCNSLFKNSRIYAKTNNDAFSKLTLDTFRYLLFGDIIATTCITLLYQFIVV